MRQQTGQNHESPEHDAGGLQPTGKRNTKLNLNHFRMHEVTMYDPMRTLCDHRFKLIWNLNSTSPWMDANEVVRRSPWAETVRRGDKFIGKRPIEKYLWRDPVELYDLQNDPDEVVKAGVAPPDDYAPPRPKARGTPGN